MDKDLNRSLGCMFCQAQFVPNRVTEKEKPSPTPTPYLTNGGFLYQYNMVYDRLSACLQRIVFPKLREEDSKQSRTLFSVLFYRLNTIHNFLSQRPLNKSSLFFPSHMPQNQPPPPKIHSFQLPLLFQLPHHHHLIFLQIRIQHPLSLPHTCLKTNPLLPKYIPFNFPSFSNSLTTTILSSSKFEYNTLSPFLTQNAPPTPTEQKSYPLNKSLGFSFSPPTVGNWNIILFSDKTT